MVDLRSTLIRRAAWAFYVVLVFEILFMISVNSLPIATPLAGAFGAYPRGA